MKKVMYGTVSALALMLAATGIANAKYERDRTKDQVAIAFAGSDAFVGFNCAYATAVFGDNEIDRNAFGQAKGAFNVGQNESVNSAVAQSMAVAAVINSPDSSDTAPSGANQLALAGAGGHQAVIGNSATWTLATSHNEIEDNAFGQSAGAFQVLQNHSINSAVQQDMAVAAIVNNDQDSDSNNFANEASLASSQLSAAVAWNHVGISAVGSFRNTNSLTDNAFGQAKGAYNVLQNASINSSVQQSMAIGAIVNNQRP
jgi:hypothetical protein